LRFAEPLILRFGALATLMPGLALIALGLALLQRVPVDADYVRDFLPAMVMFGVGAGVAFPALMSLAMSGVGPSDAGLASGLVNTTQQVGGALGLAVLATMSSERTEDVLTAGQPIALALTNGYQLATATGAGLLIAALVIALGLLRGATRVDKGASESSRERLRL
jgi:MFS family permease